MIRINIGWNYFMRNPHITIDRLAYESHEFNFLISGELISFCAGQSRPLSCPGQDVIVFQSVMWGRTFGTSLCGFNSPQDVCASNSTLSVLTSNCFRRSWCSIDYDVISTNFRDPCSASHNELIVDYLCVPGKSLGQYFVTHKMSLKMRHSGIESDARFWGNVKPQMA